jgi:3''-Phosphoadenosine 5''-phosphosulfate (PAPS) 3''-phosphatase
MAYEQELKCALEAAKEAMTFIMSVYKKGFEVEIKSDNSPVTEADIGADKLIREILHKAFPKYAFLTEESKDDKIRLTNDYVWIVDPVDGTNDFVAKDGEFTTNIALAYKHQIVLGVVGVPVSGDIYYASKGDGAYLIRDHMTQKIHVNNKTKDLLALISRTHNTKKVDDALKSSAKISQIKCVGSSLKACLIAEGRAEVYLKYDDMTKEWDTAAFQGVLEEAGGFVLKHNGEPITYNRDDVYNRGGFICVNLKENIVG